MAHPETNFIKRINKRDRKAYGLSPHVGCWKIHDSFEGGVADCMYYVQDHPSGVTFPAANPRLLWIEYKWVSKLPTRDTTLVKPGLSELQRDWLTERSKYGENCYVFCGSPEGVYIFDDFEKAYEGIPKKEFCGISNMWTEREVTEWIEKKLLYGY